MKTTIPDPDTPRHSGPTGLTLPSKCPIPLVPFTGLILTDVLEPFCIELLCITIILILTDLLEPFFIELLCITIILILTDLLEPFFIELFYITIIVPILQHVYSK